MTDHGDAARGMTQGDSPAGLISLGPGYLDPGLIPGPLISRWAADAVHRWGPRSLAYGADAGPLGLRTMLAARTATQDGGRCGPENVLITGGTSAALDHLAASFARSGRALLTEALTYDLGRKIFDGWGLQVIGVPGPVDDIDTGEFRAAALTAARNSAAPPVIYLIPTYHNPTGRVLSQARRREVLAVAEETGALVVEDLAYADLGYESPPPPSLRALSPDPERVVSLYSFAKCLAPGLRLGWLAGGERLAGELAASPVRVSGGGPNHFTAVTVMAGIARGEFETHVAGLREQLRVRRDRLLASLASTLPSGFSVTKPAGGFFAWIRMPASVRDEALLREAQRRGVAFAPGRRFGDCAGARLCFAGCPPGQVSHGAELFARACASS